MIELYIPKFDELWYREKLLQDKDTMSYNSGYELGLDNYDYDTGCIYFSKEYHDEWYSRWIDKENRYYAYLYDKEIDAFVGEVSFRYDNELEGYCVGIIIEAKYRGKGYSKKGLKLLCNKAIYEYNAKALYDDIPSSRKEAINLFLKQGFVVDKVYYQKKFGNNEEIYLMKMDRE